MDLCLNVPNKCSPLQYLSADEHVLFFDELVDWAIRVIQTVVRP